MSAFLNDVAGALLKRQDEGADADADSNGFTVTTDCDLGNEYDGRMGVRISAIFVILVGGFLGAVVPVLLARHSKLKTGKAFFGFKYFGSGVIIGTAFMHLLSPAYEALGSPCLPEDSPITSYDWAAGICLMTIFVMFTLELIVSRFDIFGHSHDASSDPSLDVLKAGDKANGRDVETARGSGLPNSDGVSYPPGGEDHLGHHREHTENDSYVDFAAQMTAIFILEFGVIFHSIFIGLTLAVSGEEFTVLYIVLVFHQTFEGLGLGSRLATAQWPESRWFMPYLLGGLYSLATPVSIAAGLGVRSSLSPESPNTLIINGIFDSISAGILIYTGLVELLAHEFMFSDSMRKAGLKVQLAALFFVGLGILLMAILAEWA